MPGGAEGLGDLDCPCGQCLCGNVVQAKFAERLVIEGVRQCRIGFNSHCRKNFMALLRLVGEDVIDSGVADAVGDLLRREKDGNGITGLPVLNPAKSKAAQSGELPSANPIALAGTARSCVLSCSIAAASSR